MIDVDGVLKKVVGKERNLELKTHGIWLGSEKVIWL